jgi:hypothetical protein
MDKTKSVSGIEAGVKSANNRSTSLCRRAAPATGAWARNSAPAPTQKPPRVIAFPMQRARARDVHPAEVVVPAALRRSSCSVLPLRCGEAARKAVLLVKLRWLHVEIQALNAAENAQSSAQ